MTGRDFYVVIAEQHSNCVYVEKPASAPATWKNWNFTKIAGEINPADLTPERRNVLELTTKVWKNTFEAH